MPIKVVVLLDDDATEEEIRILADALGLFPPVLGVWKYEGDERITHDAPGLTQ